MVTLIAAIAKNNCIGINGTLPWDLPEDRQRFKMLTTGHVVIMGRKTWESLPERFRPLPKRLNIILTKNTAYPLPTGCEQANSLAEAINAHSDQEIFIIGGEAAYREGLAIADRLEITHVDQVVDGDAFFPNIDPHIWKKVTEEKHQEYTFSTYERASDRH